MNPRTIIEAAKAANEVAIIAGTVATNSYQWGQINRLASALNNALHAVEQEAAYLPDIRVAARQESVGLSVIMGQSCQQAESLKAKERV